MKRLVPALLLITIAAPLLALAPRAPERGNRIGVLRSAYSDAAASDLSAAIERELTKQLREVGFDAFDAGVSIRDLDRDAQRDIDFYVSIEGDTSEREHAAVDVGTRNVGVGFGVLVASVAAEVRLYDGKTLELIDRYELQREKRSVAPTSIGVGNYGFFVHIALPIVQRAQQRAAVRGVAADAAKRIAQR